MLINESEQMPKLENIDHKGEYKKDGLGVNYKIDNELANSVEGGCCRPNFTLEQIKMLKAGGF